MSENVLMRLATCCFWIAIALTCLGIWALTEMENLGAKIQEVSGRVQFLEQQFDERGIPIE